MKKIILCLLCAIMALGLVACGGKKDAGDKENAGIKASAADLVNAAVDKLSDLPACDSMYTGDEGDQKGFEFLCDFPYDKVKEFGIKYSIKGTADEVFVIILKDEADVAEMKASLEKRKESRATQFQTYSPEEVEKIQSGAIVAKANMVALIIAKDTAAAETAVKEMAK